MAQNSPKTLIDLAEYYKRNGYPVPIDILSRLLEAGIDVQKYNHS